MLELVDRYAALAPPSAFTASRNLSETCPSTTGDGTGFPNWPRMNVDQPRPGCQLADVAVQVQTVEALHFQRDVPVQQFRDGRHPEILRKAPDLCSSV